MSRATVTRAVVLFVALGAIVSILRGLSLNLERQFDIHTFQADPLVDVVLNIAVGSITALTIPFLVWRRPAAWFVVLIVNAIGAVDGVRLVMVDFGGPQHIILFVMRAAIVYVLILPDVQEQFRSGA